jgi:hypothetical protein
VAPIPGLFGIPLADPRVKKEEDKEALKEEGGNMFTPARENGEQVRQFRKWWVEAVSELIRRQGETVEAQCKVGRQYLEKAFRISEARNPEEVRARTLELWREGIEAVLQASEAQARDFTVVIEKWGELISALGGVPDVSNQGKESEAAPAGDLETLKRLAAERIRQGFAPPREIYQVQYRRAIDWTTFPEWARPSDPEMFEGSCHEG